MHPHTGSTPMYPPSRLHLPHSPNLTSFSLNVIRWYGMFADIDHRVIQHPYLNRCKILKLPFRTEALHGEILVYDKGICLSSRSRLNQDYCAKPRKCFDVHLEFESVLSLGE